MDQAQIMSKASLAIESGRKSCAVAHESCMWTMSITHELQFPCRRPCKIHPVDPWFAIDRARGTFCACLGPCRPCARHRPALGLGWLRALVHACLAAHAYGPRTFAGRTWHMGRRICRPQAWFWIVSLRAGPHCFLCCLKLFWGQIETLNLNNLH